MNPVKFRWKDGSIDNNQQHFGFIAQDIQKLIPEIIVDHEWRDAPDSSLKEWQPAEKLGLNYSEITPVLVKAIQEQQKMIEELKLELETLKQEKKNESE